MLTYAPTYLYPPSAGTDGNVPYINFGKVKAWGWDLTITHKNSIGQFKYDIGITLSKTFDKVLDYGDESSVVAHQRRKGRSSQLWLLYESDGLFQSWEEIANYPIDQDGQGNATLAPGDIKYKDQDGDHVITANDRIYVKSSAYPDFSMSLSLGFSYKGLFMNAMLQGVAGYKQQINELYTLESGSLQRFQRYHLTDTWTEDNPDAAYPRIKFASKNDNNRRESDFGYGTATTCGCALSPSGMRCRPSCSKRKNQLGKHRPARKQPLYHIFARKRHRPRIVARVSHTAVLRSYP